MKLNETKARFEESTVSLWRIWVLWFVTLSSWVTNSECFDEMYCLHLQGYRSPRRTELKLCMLSRYLSFSFLHLQNNGKIQLNIFPVDGRNAVFIYNPVCHPL